MTSLTVSSARAVAFTVVQRVFEGDAWADRALVAEAAGLDARDRALATQLAYGTVQRAATLDHVIETLAGRRKLDPPVRDALRLGLYQLVYLERVPQHAAVSESVELAKAHAPRGAGLVNAVLRRATREAPGLVRRLPEETPAEAALKHSHPEWIAQLWWDQLGADRARSLMAAGNRPAEPALRVNTLKTTRDALAAALDVPSRTAAGLPEALVLEAPFDVHGHPLFAQGHFVAQSRAAQAVGHVVGPVGTVLDLCAAPGGKATHLAALGAQVTAVEASPTRADGLRRTAERLGAELEVRVGDAREATSSYDAVLVDPPCTDLGTLALRPDARWRKRASDPGRIAVLQREILEAGARAVRPGGALVYSTCTISPAENEDQLTAFLGDHPEFALDATRPSDLPVWDHPTMAGVIQTLPGRDGTDGFFIAKLTRG